jgi:hypothetical protein
VNRRGGEALTTRSPLPTVEKRANFDAINDHCGTKAIACHSEDWRRGSVTWRDTLLDTKYDLLLPPAQRPEKFALGGRRMVCTSCDQQDCVVDTTRTGNRNGGHLWGTDLSEMDRTALLEYLKTY